MSLSVNPYSNQFSPFPQGTPTAMLSSPVRSTGGSSGRTTPSQHCTRNYIYAIDQASTKLRIPLSAIEKTKALEDDGLVPGLCRLYMQSQCRQGERCFQVHAKPSVVEQLRKEAWQAPSCCLAHGASCNFEKFPLDFSLVFEPNRGYEDAFAYQPATALPCPPDVGNGAPTSPTGGANNQNNGTVTVGLHSLCPTRYLRTLFMERGESTIIVPRSKICRDHRKGLCRFGDECSFLHICREIPLGDAPATPAEEPPTRLPPALSRPRTSGQAGTGTAPPVHVVDAHHSASSHFLGSPNSACGHVVNSFSSYNTNSMPNRSAATPATHSAKQGGSEGRTPLLHPVSSTKTSRGGSFSHNPYGDTSSFSV